METTRAYQELRTEVLADKDTYPTLHALEVVKNQRRFNNLPVREYL